MRSNCKGMPRYLEMLAKAHTEGTVPKDVRFRRARITARPCVLVRERLDPERPTLKDRYAQAKFAAVSNALKISDPTDLIKSAGNGL